MVLPSRGNRRLPGSALSGKFASLQLNRFIALKSKKITNACPFLIDRVRYLSRRMRTRTTSKRSRTNAKCCRWPATPRNTVPIQRNTFRYTTTTTRSISLDATIRRPRTWKWKTKFPCRTSNKWGIDGHWNMGEWYENSLLEKVLNVQFFSIRSQSWLNDRIYHIAENNFYLRLDFYIISSNSLRTSIASNFYLFIYDIFKSWFYVYF